MEKIFAIEGMSCHHCITTVENEFKKSGFENLEVKLGSAKVEFDGLKESESKIIAAIEEAGYKTL